jgi:hypothetical protein
MWNETWVAVGFDSQGYYKGTEQVQGLVEGVFSRDNVFIDLEQTNSTGLTILLKCLKEVFDLSPFCLEALLKRKPAIYMETTVFT